MNCIGCALSKAFQVVPVTKRIQTSSKNLIITELERSFQEIRKNMIYPWPLPYQGDEEFAFLVNHSFHPYTLGHLVIQPTRCGGAANQLNSYEAATAKELIIAIKAATATLNQQISSQRIYFWSFNEQSAQNEPSWHLHIHVAPKREYDRVAGPQWLSSGVQRGNQVRSEEVYALVETLRETFTSHLEESKT